MTEKETTLQEGNPILTHNTDEIAALIAVVGGVVIGGYLMATGAEITETTVGILTMFVGTPMGYLFGKS
jgi:hypothetical protein